MRLSPLPRLPTRAPAVVLALVAAWLLCAQDVAASVTLQFSQTGVARATGFSDSSGAAGVNGMRWGILVDTGGNGFSAGSYDPGFALNTAGFLLTNSGTISDDYYVPAMSGGTPLTTVTAAPTANDPGGTGGITTISGVPYGGITNVVSGKAFAIIWFESDTSALAKYGLLTNASATAPFVIPADGASTSYAAFFAGAVADPVKAASFAFPVLAPEIAVEVAGSGLVDGSATPVSFGTVVQSSAGTVTFTVRNTGNANLTGLLTAPRITIDGVDGVDFSVSSQPAVGTLAPGGSTTFVVRFAPSSGGVKNAALHIPSNDGDENPFDIALRGTALSTNANLAGLAPSAGTLSPSFSANTTTYTANVSNATTSITVTPTVADSSATVKVNNVSVASGSASGSINLTVGGNTITTVVTAQDGATTKTYTLTVNRAASANADLAGLVPSAGALTPVFAPGTTAYTAGVPNATTSITVTPTVADGTATVKVNNVTVASGTASGSIALAVGGNTITTLVTAQNGTTTRTYTLTVTRAPSANADLAGLAPSAGTLTPVFASGTTSYTADVPNETTSITVTPTVADGTAAVKVNNVSVASGSASGSIALAVGANTITTLVTAQDGTTTMIYTLTVTRAPSSNANLAALVPSVGTLTPAFAPGTTSYTMAVPQATDVMTLTPTVAESAATVKVNGLSVASGTASGSLTLDLGATTITTVVTAQDGTTTKTYTLQVSRRTWYELWADAQGITGPDGGPSADYDRDGRANLLEWAQGTDPKGASLAPIVVQGGTLVQTGEPVTSWQEVSGSPALTALFPRRKDRPTVGLAYTVEFSADLVSWTASGDAPQVLADDGTIEACMVVFPALVNGSQARFFRVTVTSQ